MTEVLPGQHDNDLSPYELLRLEKIRRNQARLKSLGLGVGIIKSTYVTTSSVVPTPKKRLIKDRHRQQPTRSSKRLKEKQENNSTTTTTTDLTPAEISNQILVEDDVDNNVEEDIEIDYSDKQFPKEPLYLDDDEFQVYTSLRAWRLRRKNELEVEPYKICQNRTLCELIRRVRNNPTWGKGVERSVATDLIECWGLGPSKVSPDGFGPTMISIIAENQNAKLLDASRARSQRDDQEKRSPFSL